MLNLRRLREDRGLTQKDMAEKLQVSKPTYCHYETGRYEPDLKTISWLADYFGCSIDYLLGHQTSNIIHLDSFTAKEKVAINLMKELDDDQLTLLLGYLARMTNTSLDEVQRKIEEE